jgi:hypothetical protein
MRSSSMDMDITYTKLPKVDSVTLYIAERSAPSSSARTFEIFDTLIISAKRLPSTPSLHCCAVYTIRGIIKSCPQKDSATPSSNTRVKLLYTPVTTNSCVNLQSVATQIAVLRTVSGFLYRK